MLDHPLARVMTFVVTLLTSSSAKADDPALMAGASHFWVYILASRLGGTLYIGVTNDLVRRAYEHREGLVEGFTKKHAVHRLVHFEQFDDVESAIRREKRLKSWNRAWKIELIEKNNPNWIDLYYQIAQP